MMPWLREIGEELAVGVAYASATTLPGRFRRKAVQDDAERRRHTKWFPLFIMGCLFALAVRPLIASLSLSTQSLVVSLWLLLFVLGFLLSMLEAVAFSEGPSPVRMHHVLGAAGWPARLRAAHGLEIVVFALVYALALWRIFGV